MEELVCSHFLEFAEHFHGADSRVMLAGPEESAWGIRVLALPRLSVQTVQEGAANLNEGATWPGAVQVFFPLTAPNLININGLEFDETSFALVGAGQAFSSLARGCNTWTSIGVPMSVFADLLPQSAEHLLPALFSATTMHRTHHVHRARLAQLVRRLTRGRSNPERDSAGLIPHTAEGELLYAMALAVDPIGDDQSPRGRPSVSRRTIIDRAHAWMDAHADAPVHVTDLSEAARVSVRTLRNAFVECYGVGPQTYLSMRQLHQIHAALLSAEPSRETVTGVSMRCGVWDLETMAARYKRLFGESPSHTLRFKSRGQPSVRRLRPQPERLMS